MISSCGLIQRQLLPANARFARSRDVLSACVAEDSFRTARLVGIRVWYDGKLVPFAKTYSKLIDEEIREVDRFFRQHTLERFGPARHVTSTLVFEIGFENIQLSSRHKSGIAVRFSRMLRWR